MKDEKKGTFSVELAVRDYECDMEGIVNNAIYLNYLEHARHRFLDHVGHQFRTMIQDGFAPVVTRMEIDYRKSLQSGDRIRIATHLEPYGRLRFIFWQNIFLLPLGNIILEAKVVAAFIHAGRPVPPPESLITAINDWQKGQD